MLFFSIIRETPHREFLLQVSHLEIYNEKTHDLLRPQTDGDTGPGAAQQEEIKVREDPKRGVFVSLLQDKILQSPTQLLRVIARGDQSRRTRSTPFNAQSSWTHAVVQIVMSPAHHALWYFDNFTNFILIITTDQARDISKPCRLYSASDARLPSSSIFLSQQLRQLKNSGSFTARLSTLI